MPIKISIHGNSIVGRVRKLNEDSFKYGSKKGLNGSLFVVCDGVGGHKAGEVASNYTSKKFIEYFFKSSQKDIIKRLKQTAKRINKEIYDAASEDNSKNGMGTTLVAVFLFNDKLYIANVGDSRAYLAREGILNKLTMDNSVVENMVRKGTISLGEARNHPKKNQITRCIGYDSDLEVDTYVCQLKEGDRIILCTDGLWDELDDFEINEIINISRNIDEAVNNLIQGANSKGGRDNITCLGFSYGKVKKIVPAVGNRRSPALVIVSILSVFFFLVSLAFVFLYIAERRNNDKLQNLDKHEVASGITGLDENDKDNEDNGTENSKGKNKIDVEIPSIIPENAIVGKEIELIGIDKNNIDEDNGIRWYRDGEPIHELDGDMKIDGNDLIAGEWYAKVNIYSDNKNVEEIQTNLVTVVDGNIYLEQSEIGLPQEVGNYRKLLTIPSYNKAISIGLLGFNGKMYYCFKGDSREGFKEVGFNSSDINNISNIFLKSINDKIGYRICLMEDDKERLHILEEEWYEKRDTTSDSKLIVVDIDNYIKTRPTGASSQTEYSICNFENKIYLFYGEKDSIYLRWFSIDSTPVNGSANTEKELLVEEDIKLIDIAKFIVDDKEIIGLLIERKEQNNKIVFFEHNENNDLIETEINGVELETAKNAIKIESQYNSDKKLDNKFYIINNNGTIKTYEIKKDMVNNEFTAEDYRMYKVLNETEEFSINKLTHVSICENIIYIIHKDKNDNNILLSAKIGIE